MIVNSHDNQLWHKINTTVLVLHDWVYFFNNYVLETIYKLNTTNINREMPFLNLRFCIININVTSRWQTFAHKRVKHLITNHMALFYSCPFKPMTDHFLDKFSIYHAQ